MSPLFREWLEPTNPVAEAADLWCCSELPGGRERIAISLGQIVVDHLIGAELLADLEFPRTAALLLEHRVPTSARQRSGDFGEILATEYVDECTEFFVPVRRLRWKGDRELPMPGDDVIGLATDGRPRLIKGEAKSSERLRASTVLAASEALDRGSGRAKPETLAFLSVRLRELGEDATASTIEAFLADVDDRQIEHLLFTVSGNDPVNMLRDHLGSERSAIRRHVVGAVVADHPRFIADVFDGLNA